MASTHYCIYTETEPNHLKVVGMIEFMNSWYLHTIVSTGTVDVCNVFCGKYTEQNPYIIDRLLQPNPEAVKQAAEQAQKAKSPMGGVVPERKPIGQGWKRTAGAITEEDKIEMLQKAFKEACGILHMAAHYCGMEGCIDANIVIEEDARYILSLRKLRPNEDFKSYNYQQGDTLG